MTPSAPCMFFAHSRTRPLHALSSPLAEFSWGPLGSPRPLSQGPFGQSVHPHSHSQPVLVPCALSLGCPGRALQPLGPPPVSSRPGALRTPLGRPLTPSAGRSRSPPAPPPAVPAAIAPRWRRRQRRVRPGRAGPGGGVEGPWAALTCNSARRSPVTRRAPPPSGPSPLRSAPTRAG